MNIRGSSFLTYTKMFSYLLLPLLLFTLPLSLYGGQTVVTSSPWVPSLDIDWAFRFDGLSVLFALLISGVGFLIQIYTQSYMRGKKGAGKLHLYLTMFMLSMYGLVLAEHLILLFVFWELTTLTSYLLIGFEHENERARKNALMAMLITGLGGLTMLAGFILLGSVIDSYLISDLLAQADTIQNHEYFIPSMLLILCGALTKSAQFPFHFWLPGAMAAPAPVSAYLHSATMVKAGIYLLARLLPVYGDADLWMLILGFAGGTTAIWSCLLALSERDMKLMLAHSTNVALGQLTMLLALGTPVAMTAALLFILAHGFYKAALFMSIGLIDKATGSRDYSVLRQLYAPLTFGFIAVILAAASKAGLPFWMGFLSKEYMYKAGLDFELVITLTFLFANMVMVLLALIIVIKPFLAKLEPEQEAQNVTPAYRKKRDWIPPFILAVLGFIMPFFGLSHVVSALIDPMVIPLSADGQPVAVKLWQGFNMPLALSGLTLLLGIMAYLALKPLHRFVATTMSPLPSGFGIFYGLLNGLLAMAKGLMRVMQSRKLSNYAAMFFGTLALFLLFVFPFDGLQMNFLYDEIRFYEWMLAALLLVGGCVTAFTGSRLLAICSLGTVGFISTLIFMIYGAPDVAKTQLLVETLLVVFLALIMHNLPPLQDVKGHCAARKIVHLGIASVIGLFVFVVLVEILKTPFNTSISDYYGAKSMPEGYGRNIVNVILVDFRAFDTLGEVIVVVIAAISSAYLFRSNVHLKKRRKAS